MLARILYSNHVYSNPFLSSHLATCPISFPTIHLIMGAALSHMSRSPLCFHTEPATKYGAFTLSITSTPLLSPV